MTVLHLAAKFGHVDVLEVLRGKVPWSMASVKVKGMEKKLLHKSKVHDPSPIFSMYVPMDYYESRSI